MAEEERSNVDMTGVEEKLDKLIDVLTPEQPPADPEPESEPEAYNPAEYIHPLRGWMEK